MNIDQTKRYRWLVHESNTERQQIAPSISSSKQLLKNMPKTYDLQLAFPIHHTVRTILIEFKSALKKANYKCLDMGTKQILAIRLTLMDRANKLFKCKEPPKFIILVETQQFLSMRIATIKSLQSNSVFAFKQSRPNELNQEIQRIGKILQALPNLNVPPAVSAQETNYDYKQDFYSLDAVSQYIFGRILADRNYSIGSKMQKVSEKFNSLSKKQAFTRFNSRWLSDALNEISQDLLQDFNCSRQELLEILAYCRKSVEQYFYNQHRQFQANHQNVEIPLSHNYPQQIKQLSNILPHTCNQLYKFQKSLTTMDIFTNMFLFGLIYRTESTIKELQPSIKNRSLQLIKKCYSTVMTKKTKVLLNFGYQEQDYEQFISHLDFSSQIVI